MSNHYVVHLKLIYYYMSAINLNIKKNFKRKGNPTIMKRSMFFGSGQKFYIF